MVQRVRPARIPPYSCSRDGRGAGALDGTVAGRLTPMDGLGVTLAGRVTIGLAAERDLTAVVLGLVVLLVRAVTVFVVPAFGRAADFGLAVALGFRAVSLDFAFAVADAFVLTTAFFPVLTVLARGAAAVGFAADIFLAAALSALAAAVMALVAVLIA
jgi:hypothetical protein